MGRKNESEIADLTLGDIVRKKLNEPMVTEITVISMGTLFIISSFILKAIFRDDPIRYFSGLSIHIPNLAGVIFVFGIIYILVGMVLLLAGILVRNR